MFGIALISAINNVRDLNPSRAVNDMIIIGFVWGNLRICPTKNFTQNDVVRVQNTILVVSCQFGVGYVFNM